MPTRNAEVEWKGNFIEGAGRLRLGSGVFEGPYSFKSRIKEGQSATSPEELVGAAHAGCFADPVVTAQRIHEVSFGSWDRSTDMRCLFLISS